MHTNIMVSYDGSKESLRALDEARELMSSAPQMKLNVVQIVSDADMDTTMELGWYGTMGDFQSSDPAVLARMHDRLTEQCAERLRAELEPHLAGLANEVEFHAILQAVSISDTLLDFVKYHDIDLIVMGCRGLGAIRGVLGSVSYAVLRSSPVPVLIAK